MHAVARLRTHDDRAGSRRPLAWIGATAVAVAAAVLAAHFVWMHDDTKLLPPDTPPAEYLYLDSDRVLAYLGQIEGGLPPSAKRVRSQTESAGASIKGGLVAEITGAVQRHTSIEEIVSPQATDRFFSLLVRLRSGREKREHRTVPWIHDINAEEDGPDDAETLRNELRDVDEGDFVRISNVHLSLPPFAAAAPRTRYAEPYVPDPEQTTRPKGLTRSLVGRKHDLTSYLRELGADPILPFVVRTLSADGHPLDPVTFFIPARYSGLLDNARLLAGSLTVVGKVTYIDPRLPDDKRCTRHELALPAPCLYFDSQTAETFAPALEHAPDSVLRVLGITRRGAIAHVQSAVRFKAPVVVVLPVAIYQ